MGFDHANDLYTLKEVAKAARVTVRRVADLVETGQFSVTGGLIEHDDAIQIVRLLRGVEHGAVRPLLTIPRRSRRRGVLPLLTSSALHGLMLVLLVTIASLHALTQTPPPANEPTRVNLVFLEEPGPGGGGGGGGAEALLPAAPAQVKRTIVPPPRKTVSVPPPRRRPAVVPAPVVVPVPDVPKPAQAIAAPVQPVAADDVETTGIPAPAAPTSSSGPGTGGGAGTGAGSGAGEGDGAGLGPGSGGGTGGGVLQPGSGVTAPTLEREVKPIYTDDARRRAIEGDVVLQIVVRRDGSVGTVRVLRSLDAGLDERAVDAVRRWRFGPARRLGTPVDVSVTVSVGFSLR